MRVACALVTSPRAQVEMKRHPHLKDASVLVVGRAPSKARSPVVDHFPSARGVKDGMALEQAMSRHANAGALNADQPHYGLVFSRYRQSGR